MVDGLQKKISQKDSVISELVTGLITANKLWGILISRWIEPDLRDEIVAFVNHCDARTPVSHKFLLYQIGLSSSKFHQ